jgi:cyanophycinase
LTAYRSGAVIAGSSAGAMVLCEYYYDPVTAQVVNGLNLVERICILPHHNTFGKDWAPRLKKRLPDLIMFGIDEQTGTLNDASQENWRVYGKGKITLYHSGLVDKFGAGQEFDLKNAVREL